MTAPVAGVSRRVNLIGYVSGNLGLGVAARALGKAALARGFEITVLDLDPGNGRGGFEMDPAFSVVDKPSELAAGINLFVLPPLSVVGLLFGSEVLTQLLEREDCFHALFTFWELPVLPPACSRALELFDAVVAPSGYIEGALDFALSGTRVVRGLTPVEMPPDIEPDRARFGIPADSFVALSSFDPLSDPERKNPQAAIEAFRRAFGNDASARLVVKLNVPAGGYADEDLNRRVLQPLLQRLQADGRTLVITETLTYRDVLSLYSSADAFISLHRAEGLGLGLLESMALGKPVVATGWSGNKVFMSPANSCPVGHRLVPVQASNWSYSAVMKGLDPIWAEPDIDDAALWLRQLAADTALRARIGAAARGAFEKYQTEAAALGFLDDLVALMAHRSSGAGALSAGQRHQLIVRARDELRLAHLSTSQVLIRRARAHFDQHIGWRLRNGRKLTGTTEKQ